MPDEVTIRSPTSSDELKLRICFIRLFWVKNSQPSSSRGSAKISNEKAPLLFMSAQSFVSSSVVWRTPHPSIRVGSRVNDREHRMVPRQRRWCPQESTCAGAVCQTGSGRYGDVVCHVLVAFGGVLSSREISPRNVRL